MRRHKFSRVETMLFPFTDKPWLKVWTITPGEPFWSRGVSGLDRLDLARIFSTPFLDRLMPRSRDLTGDVSVDGVDLGNLLVNWCDGRGRRM